MLVIGGGDTGSDCIGTAHRQGARSVTQIEIMPKPPVGPDDPKNPWPNWPRTLKTTSSHEEGCVRRWNINSLEFLGKDGKLTGVRVQPIDWKPNPEGGRPIMAEAGKPEVIKAQVVLLAMGFLRLSKIRICICRFTHLVLTAKLIAKIQLYGYPRVFLNAAHCSHCKPPP